MSGLMHSITRRNLIKQAGSSLACLGLPATHAWAVNNPGLPRLVVVFLRGGYDGLSAFYPYNNALYHSARPRTALPAPDQLNGALALDDRWAMHPSLAKHLGPLWRSGQMALMPFCGLPAIERSHFLAQDLMAFGLDPKDLNKPKTGFMNRLLLELPQANQALSLTDNLPLAWLGNRAVANVAMPNERTLIAKKPNLQDIEVQAALKTMYKGHALGQAWAQGFEVKDQLMNALARSDPDDSNLSNHLIARIEALPNGFPIQAAKAGLFLRKQPAYKLAWLETDGWDTHQFQGSLTGALPNLLDNLGLGLAEFKTQLGEAEWHRTVVVVMSEFGRTFYENGTAGTDHGWGNNWFMLGGSLARKGILGSQVDITTERLNEGRDMPVINDYRLFLRQLSHELYALSPAALQRVFS